MIPPACTSHRQTHPGFAFLWVDGRLGLVNRQSRGVNRATQPHCFYNNILSRPLWLSKSLLAAHFQSLRLERQRYHWQEGTWNAGTGFSSASRCRRRNWLAQGWWFSGCGKAVSPPPGNSGEKQQRERGSQDLTDQKCWGIAINSNSRLWLPTGPPTVSLVCDPFRFDYELAIRCTHREEEPWIPTLEAGRRLCWNRAQEERTHEHLSENGVTSLLLGQQTLGTTTVPTSKAQWPSDKKNCSLPTWRHEREHSLWTLSRVSCNKSRGVRHNPQFPQNEDKAALSPGPWEHREENTRQLVVAGAFFPVFKQKYTNFGHVLSRANKNARHKP